MPFVFLTETGGFFYCQKFLKFFSEKQRFWVSKMKPFVQWFKDRGQWLDGSAKPVPGMIIFFDWDNKGSSGAQDGESDHVGIVEKVENGIVWQFRR